MARPPGELRNLKPLRAIAETKCCMLMAAKRSPRKATSYGTALMIPQQDHVAEKVGDGAAKQVRGAKLTVSRSVLNEGLEIATRIAYQNEERDQSCGKRNIRWEINSVLPLGSPSHQLVHQRGDALYQINYAAQSSARPSLVMRE